MDPFWLSDPYIFKVFFLVSVGFLSLKTDNSTQPLPAENSGEFDSLQPLLA